MKWTYRTYQTYQTYLTVTVVSETAGLTAVGEEVFKPLTQKNLTPGADYISLCFWERGEFQDKE